MTKVRRLLFSAALLLSVAHLTGQAGPSQPRLEVLFDAHRWFDLRDAVVAEASPFFRGAVASAFNDSDVAEKELRLASRSAADSEGAYAAHQLLTYLYWRAARYRETVAELDALARIKPDAADVKQFRSLFASLARFPQQTLAARRYSKLRYVMRSGNLFIPVSVNGQPATYMVDTGANLPVISAGEARRRHLKVVTGRAGKLGDSPVYSLEVGDVAMADELAVGATRLQNVSFLVMPDDRFADVPPEQQAIIGLPILLAFRSLRWSADGTFEIDFPAPPHQPSSPNICFDGAMPVTQVTFGDRKLDFTLDTGAVQTHLYPRFKTDFPTLVNEFGQPGTTRAVGAAGTVDLDSISLPEVNLRIGGFGAVLRPAPVLREEVGSKWHYGNLGLDLLSQARVVTLDFRTMSLGLE